MDTIFMNGYKIRWNPLWCEWQVSHDDIGNCESFTDVSDAIKYCDKG